MTLFVFLAALLAFATAILLGYPLIHRREHDGAAKHLRLAAIAAAGIAPMVAGFIYLSIGTPMALNPVVREAAGVNPSAAIAALPTEERAAMIGSMVEGLAARLESQPDDPQGWRMLARSYGVLGLNDEAANAWREALSLSQGNADDWRGLAIALMEQNTGENGPAIKEAFEEVLEQRADDPLALYFLGNAARANGNNQRALDLWKRLRATVPDNVPFAAELDALISSVESSEQTLPEQE